MTTPFIAVKSVQVVISVL